MNVLSDDYKTVSVPLDGELYNALNLAPAGHQPAEVEAAAMSSFENGMKVQSMLRTMVNLAASQFPLMTAEEWCMALEATQCAGAFDRAMVQEGAVSPESRTFLLSEIQAGYSDAEREELDLSRFNDLLPAETFSICFVSERFWANESCRPADLRQLLSQISRRPAECVFSDDPAPEDLWAVTEVTRIDDGNLRAEYSFNGIPMASLILELRGKEVWTGKHTCKETRPLVLPTQSLRKLLFSLALPHVAQARVSGVPATAC